MDVEDDKLVLPCRIDVCLPGTHMRLFPIPLKKVYHSEEKILVRDCFQNLNHTVQMLLDTASHLTPTEREKLRPHPAAYVDVRSGILLHPTEKTYANFAMECILKQHNSNQPVLLSPTWPSVFFDHDGYPSFVPEEQQAEQQAQQVEANTVKASNQAHPASTRIATGAPAATTARTATGTNPTATARTAPGANPPPAGSTRGYHPGMRLAPVVSPAHAHEFTPGSYPILVPPAGSVGNPIPISKQLEKYPHNYDPMGPKPSIPKEEDDADSQHAVTEDISWYE